MRFYKVKGEVHIGVPKGLYSREVVWWEGLLMHIVVTQPRGCHYSRAPLVGTSK